MTKPAAFQATFTDWRLIKGRKVVQVVFEVPLEGANEAYQVLGGMPDPGKSVWCAIARLDPDTAAKPRKSVATDKGLAQRAGMLCADPVFAKFMVEEGKARSADEEEIAASVRRYCGVASRSEIIPGTAAAERWDKLSSRFSVWLTAPELAG